MWLDTGGEKKLRRKFQSPVKWFLTSDPQVRGSRNWERHTLWMIHRSHIPVGDSSLLSPGVDMIFIFISDVSQRKSAWVIFNYYINSKAYSNYISWQIFLLLVPKSTKLIKFIFKNFFSQTKKRYQKKKKKRLANWKLLLEVVGAYALLNIVAILKNTMFYSFQCFCMWLKPETAFVKNINFWGKYIILIMRYA